MASRDVYTMKEFMEIISIQEQTCFQKSRYEQSRRRKEKEAEVDDDDEEHPLVTEMFGELYFRESPTSTLEGLFSPPRAATPELPAADPLAEEMPSEETKAASDDDGGSDDDHGNGKDDQTPELASPPPN
ncbi:PREDICTED: uncharacterized protein LOC109147909 [Ipomoea nil]|uniref:uncharacterized protein LOC109147909 n=1 Tax=Ipomoea nil TaxID=35883 RepID=UPI000901762A|nr:PREDICTED: uncharacterized protein LOC109147909 [Ipomoea nil]XP_019151112.1 PREDICTED: uncharacterized protein LOC109147909 [Ipomoea nil]